MTPRWPQRLRQSGAHIRWAFGTAHAVAPWLFAAAALNAVILAVLPAGIALSVRGLVNSVGEASAGTPLEETAAYLWLLVGFGATLGGSVGHAVNVYITRRFEIELRNRLHLDIARHHAAMPLERMEDKSYLNALRRAQTSPEIHVAHLYSFSLELATKAVQMLSLMAILFAIEPWLFFLLLPVGLPFLLFRWRLVRRQFEAVNRRVEKERRISYYGGLLTDVEQAGEIKLLELGPVFIDRYRLLMEELRRLQLDYLGFEFIGNLLFALASVTAIYLALAHALSAIVAGQLTIGDLAIFGGAASQLRALVDQSVGLIAGQRWQLLNVEKLREFFQIDPGTNSGGAAPMATLKGRIELREVGFRYPGSAHDTLRGLSFTIEPGETVALVGDNGAGKSTIAKLVAGLYEVQAGSILFDGQDVRTLDRRQLRRQIACVFQQFGRYEASAADTLAFGDWPRLGGDRAALEDIARRAQVHDLISDMPEGYDTQLGRRFGHHQPSGGQWQRLAIARLIGRDARLLILDEPTANLDVGAEAELFEQFRALAAGRTTLLISHRFSTVSMADRILVIDGGRIVENGSHRELLALNGRYAALFALAFRFPEHPAEQSAPPP
ncbi:ABC transporter ATP-binding protein [Methylomagnum sp.]